MNPNRQTRDTKQREDVTLYLSLLAWTKWKWFRKDGSVEVGMWGVASESNPGHIVDMLIPAQVCHAAETNPTAVGLADMMEDAMDLGIPPSRLMPYWFHTHPGHSCHPSGTDEATLEGMLKDHMFVVMGIMAANEDVYVRYTQVKPFPFVSDMELKVVTPGVDSVEELRKIQEGLSGGWQSEYNAKITVAVREPTVISLGNTLPGSYKWGYQGGTATTQGDAYLFDDDYYATPQVTGLAADAGSIFFGDDPKESLPSELERTGVIKAEDGPDGFAKLEERCRAMGVEFKVIGSGWEYPSTFDQLSCPVSFVDKFGSRYWFDVFQELFVNARDDRDSLDKFQFQEGQTKAVVPLWEFNGRLYYVDVEESDSFQNGFIAWLDVFHSRELDLDIENYVESAAERKHVATVAT